MLKVLGNGKVHLKIYQKIGGYWEILEKDLTFPMNG